jgi:probable phosphoglycerate mutase
MKTLIFVRHGNTFKNGETPTRVGCRTDLELTENWRSEKAARIIEQRGLKPSQMYTSPLRRTTQTAKIILKTLKLDLPINTLPIFSEIDYGLDENQTEYTVQLRLGKHYLAEEGKLDRASELDILERGKEAIELWDKKAIPPAGWEIEPEKIIENLRNFASEINNNETVLAVSSNGIIRFTPHILSGKNYDEAVKNIKLKVTTGGVCIFKNETGSWKLSEWNIATLLF